MCQARGSQRKRKGGRIRVSIEETVSLSVEIDLQNQGQVARELKKLERQMQKYAANLEFEQAARTRDQIKELKEMVFLSAS